MDEKNTTCLHIEVGKVLIKITYFTVNFDSKRFQVIKETEQPTSHIVNSNSKGLRKSQKSIKSSKTLENLSEQILNYITAELGFDINEIDYITADTDFYDDFKTPAGAQKTIKKFLDFFTTKTNQRNENISLEKPRIAANELKSKAVSRGAKRIISGRVKNNLSPHVFLDVSTYISGLTYTYKNSKEITGLVSGLGMNILDAIAQAHGDLDSKTGTTLQLPEDGGKVYENEVDDCVSKISKLMSVKRVPSGTKRVGGIPVNVEASYKSEIKLIGCDVGKNGSKLNQITRIGQRAASFGNSTFNKVVNSTLSLLICKTIRALYNEGIASSKSKVCISGRMSFSKELVREINTQLKLMGFEKIGENLVFIENPASFGFLRSKSNSS